MSSILRALKKLEKDSRHLGESPPLESKFVPLADTAPPRSFFRLFFMVTGAGVICGVVFLAGWYFFSGRQPSQAPGSAKTPVLQPQAVQAPPVHPPIPAEPPAGNIAAEDPGKNLPGKSPERIAAPEAPPAAEQTAVPAIEPRQPAVTAADIGQAVTLTQAETGTDAEGPALPDKEPELPPAEPAADKAVAIGAPPAAAVPAKAIPKLNDPAMKLQAIAWSREPQKRLAVINNRIVREGEPIAGYLISTINEDDIILSRAGEKWQLLFRIK